MAITIGSATTIYTGVNLTGLSAVKANNDIIGCQFEDVNSVPIEVSYILFNRQTLTPGSKSQIETGATTLVLKALQIVDNSVLVFYQDASDDDGWGRIITNSGTTPAQQPEAEFLNNSNSRDLVAGKHDSLAVGLLAVRDSDDSPAEQTHFIKFTVAAGNVSFSSDTEATDNPTTLPFDLIHLTGNKYIYSAYHSTDRPNVRVLDTTTGIMEHTVYTLAGYSILNNLDTKLCKIDETRFLMFFPDNSQRYAVVVTLSGTSTLTFGTPVAIGSGTGPIATILKRNSNKFVLGWSEATWQFQTVTVTGTTITQDGDTGSVNLGSAADVHILGFLDDDGAIVYINDIATQLVYRPMTNLPALSAGDRFYYGTTLTERGALPFFINGPAGLAVRGDKAVALGGLAAGAGGEIVVRGSVADSYAAWTNITGSLAGVPVNALNWINGEEVI